MKVKKITSLEVVRAGSNPDIDSDFNTLIRDEVKDMVAEKHGRNNMADIITFNSLAAKSAFKAMCTIYDVPFAQSNKIGSLVPPPIEGVDCTLDDIFNPESDRYSEGADFRNATSGEQWKKIIAGARAIEGRYKSTGVHPCGSVISSKNLQEVIPLQVRSSDGRVITQWTYPECEALGLIKFDFLGLDTVDLVQHSVEYIMRAGKPAPSMVDIVHGAMDDKKTYEMLSRGATIGVFQLGSPLVQDYLPVMKPTTFEDICAATALLRPGPMGMLSHVRYANRKNGREEVAALHPAFKGSALEEILGKTYGLCVYQEQVMRIANQIGGMTLQEGDELRSAMGKKKIDKMMKMKPKFFEGALAQGFPEDAVNKIWDTIAEFAKYGFNRCAHGDTLVLDEHGRKLRLRDLYKRWEAGERDIKLLSMWEDGEIRPHRVRKVVYTGKKPVFEVRTASGRAIKITEEHRLLTTGGYGSLEDGGLAVGVELMVDETVRASEHSPLTPGASSTWSEREPRWVEEFAHSLATREVFGEDFMQLSDGRRCATLGEAAAAEYLLARGVPFELRRQVGTEAADASGAIYAQGIYFEMDGLMRGEDYFRENKYGDVPFVYLTPYNFVDKIDEALLSSHAKNGDRIVEIRRVGKHEQKVYDVEMELEGPSNFIANGVVSHNSHSVAYAMLAYQTAFLKSNYPVEFMAALISQNVGNKEKILMFLQEARRMGLKVGSVDINLSDVRVAPDFVGESAYEILYGLSGVNAVSVEVAKTIVREREENGFFKSVQDLLNRCSPLGVSNKKVYENLALAGAFDRFGVSRRAVVENLGAMLGESKTKATMGLSLFDLMGDEEEAQEEVDLSGEDYSFVEKLQKEADVIGLYLTDHPLGRAGVGLGAGGVVPIKKLMASTATTTVTVVGSVTEVVKKIRKQGGKSIQLTLDDGTGYIQANLQRDLVKGMDKHSAQERVRKLYASGEKSLSAELELSATDPEFEAIPEVTKNTLYLASVTYRPPFAEGQYGARINDLRPLHLSHEGKLPVRIRVSTKLGGSPQETRARILKFSQLLAERHPGDYPLFAAVVTEEDLKKVADDSLYYAALADEMRSEASPSEAERPAARGAAKKASAPARELFHEGSPEEEEEETPAGPALRELPPQEWTEEDLIPLTEDELADRVLYFDTGFRVAKTPEVEQLLSDKFGAERVDFGIFNTSMTLNES